MDFQKLLLDVGKDISRDDVKALLYLCTDLLDRNQTSVEARDLFRRLQDKDHLSAERPHLVKELLLIIKRNRLIRDLGLHDFTTSNLISPYRKLLYNLSEGITDDDLRNVKFLLIGRLDRRKLEENVSTLEVFLAMEHMDLIDDTNLKLLETIVQSVCPMLKEKINRFKALQETNISPSAEETGRQRSVSFPNDQNQVPQSLDLERAASCQLAEIFPSMNESTMNTSNTSLDLPEGQACEVLPGLSDLNIGTSSCGYLRGRIDALEMLPSQKNMASSEMKTSLATNTHIEVLGKYPMTAEKRGICLIVNNYKFAQSFKTREGTNLDAECLWKVFEWLGFETVLEKDLKGDEIMSMMLELGRRNHNQMDCLVCCILSHGKEGSVHGVDGQPVEIKRLMERVNGSHCPSLAGKPKLFFIQACQGNSEQKAVYIEADAHAESYIFSDAYKASDTIPADADFLLGMSTVASFVSFRDKRSGSWYIQSLCQNLVQMVPIECDLGSIMTKVNADVSKKSNGISKQMPQLLSTLRKNIVFPIPKARPPVLPA
ncbi:caspase-8 isoform X1 [Gymnodraco acuticeps]|uniref:Caspase-8 n=1 Tax=Gymnodraco acuticeps TaxID=8218 RepID=A0A6P8TY29_GYMAC|nr:caspase-8 isoform X1 [Gymnodraco acuticeps]